MSARTILISAIYAAMATSATDATASGLLDLSDITSGVFNAEQIGEAVPMPGGETYARLDDKGKQIAEYSFKTGKRTATLFDAGSTVGESVASIDGFKLSPDGTKMLIQTSTEKIYRHSFSAVYYIYDISDRRMERLSDYGPQQSPVWSPNGQLIAFVRDNNIYLVKLLYGNAESQVTKDGEAGKTINGAPDWVNEEEFAFNTALTFTADSKMLCWIKYDESAVKEYSIPMYKGAAPERGEYASHPGSLTYKYPKAGEDNSKASVWSFDIQSKQTRRMDVPVESDGYVPRIKSSTEADNIIVYTMNRHQDELRLYKVNARSTVARLLLKEGEECYVKEETMEQIAIYPGHIVVPSDRGGSTQLYLYSAANGQLIRQLTSCDGDVTAVYGYDEASGSVYYQAAGKDAMNREVYVTDKKGKTTCLTPESGWNRAVMFSEGFRYFIHEWSDCDTPYRVTTRDNKGKTLATLIDNKALADKLAEYDMPEKKFFTFTTSDGATLNGVIIRPENIDGQKEHPAIMWQYGGPGSQQVTNSWNMGSITRGALYDAYLAQNGFIVACVDGRGTGGRGSRWEKCVYKKLGSIESRDQAEAAAYLGSLPYIDKDNIGIWGWSYGGFNALMAMSCGQRAFKAGVAVAPVTDWRFYDTIYTERYMRTPGENPEGYGDNPISRASALHGALLICHGLADDNVHTQNTFEYTEALVQADKDFRMNIYTNRNHSIHGGNTRTHLLRQIAQHFKATLQ